MRRPRKVIATVLVFLLLGAIVNIAVAWGITSSRRPLDTWPRGDWADHWANLSHDVCIGMRKRVGDLCIRSDVLGSLSSSAARRSFAELRELLPPDSPFRTHDGDGPFVRRTTTPEPPALTYQCGYPCLSSGFELFVDHNGMTETGVFRARYEGAFVLEANLPRGADVVVPIRPIWPGFAINTLFYAAILWLLFAAPFALRRWRRSKRGLCPACAYPVGASDLCTECGMPVHHRS